MSATTTTTETVADRTPMYSWFVLFVLCSVYILNFLDRQLVAILGELIKEDLNLTDEQLGMLGGIVFAAFYTIIGVPVGWLADRTNRVMVVSIACGIWSAATIACGLSRNFGQLAVSRMTVGFGEAGGVPPSYAIVTDYFPPGRRGMALSIYNLGPPVGAALGIYNLGPPVGAARGGLDQAVGAPPPERAPFWGTVRMFFSRPTLVLASFASGVTQIITYGLGNFAVLFLMREKGMTLNDVALWYALVVFIGMGGGIFASGWLIDRFTRRSKKAYALLPAMSLALALPFYVAFVWAPSWPLALALLAAPTFLNYFYLSSSVALVQEEVKPNQRVMSGALLLLVMNFIGMGVGPTYVGAASDFFRATNPEHSLQLALYTLTPIYVAAVCLFLWLARLLGRDTSRAGGPQ